MAKLCGKCGGSGWWGARTDFGHRPGGPCRACDGSGYDKRWGEKSCKTCSNTIEYRYDWSSVPEYCPSCKSDQYKNCANSHCNGTVRYKKFWNKIPDYCQACKGWYEIKCQECESPVKVHSDWKNLPKWCDSCKRNGIGKTAWKTKYNSETGVGTNQKGQFEKPYPQHNTRDLDTEDHTHYDPNNQRSGKASGNRSK